MKVLKLTSEDYQGSRRFAKEVLHGYENHSRILALFRDRRATNLQVGSLSGQAAIVVGSGPGLDEVAPRLASWGGVVVASTSHLTTLCYHHRPPDFCIAVDADTPPLEVAGVSHRKTTLLTHPGIGGELLDKWKGRFQFFRPTWYSIPLYSQILPIAYAFITTAFEPFGCAAAAAVSAAVLLGCRPIFLAGMDFDPAGRFHGKRPAGWGRWVSEDYSNAASVPVSEKSRESTAQLTRWYAGTTLCAIRRLDAHVAAMGSCGLPGIPRYGIEEVLAHPQLCPPLRGKHGRPLLEAVLADMGVYTVTLKDGSVRFTSTAEPAEALPLYYRSLEEAGEIESAAGALQKLEALLAGKAARQEAHHGYLS